MTLMTLRNSRKSKNIALLECLEKENLFLTLNEIGILKKLKK